MVKLLKSFGKKGKKLNLLSLPADIEDNQFLSRYFILPSFSPVFSGGKNSVFVNTSPLLMMSSEIFIECLDSNGDNLFIELAKISNDIVYKEASAWIISIHVYDDTHDGIGKLVLYGASVDNKRVRWTSNIIINKSKPNTSDVRFYNKPTIEVFPLKSPLINNANILSKPVILTGSFYGQAVNPSRDSNRASSINEDVDYRIIFSTTSSNNDIFLFNSQIVGLPIKLNISKIKSHKTSNEFTDTNISSSFIIKNVVNSTTLKIDSPVFYKNDNNKDIVVDVISGSFEVEYPYVVYNTGSAQYTTLNTGHENIVLQQSLAEITYRNIKTFSGYVARHKVYRKSLFLYGDFEVIADEPVKSNELLKSSISNNKAFDKIGSFYNDFHIHNYWFTSSNDFNLLHNSSENLNSLEIYTNNPESVFDGNKYVIVKDNSSPFYRNSSYLAFDQNEFDNLSGSHYDSNFIELKGGVQYLISFNSALKKTTTESGSLSFYFTSSLVDATHETNFVSGKGIKLAEIEIDNEKTKYFFDNQEFFFSVANDLYGTLIIIPFKCNASISNVSLKAYGDDGFSPDVLVTKIPFPINIPNETYEIRAELFDVNSNLVYSNLKTVQSFDASGSTLTSYMPIYNPLDPSKNNFISGSLNISKSLEVGKSVTIYSGSLFRILDLKKNNNIPYFIGVNSTGSVSSSLLSDDGGLLYYSTRHTTYDDSYIYINEDGLIKAKTLNISGSIRRVNV